MRVGPTLGRRAGDDTAYDRKAQDRRPTETASADLDADETARAPKAHDPDDPDEIADRAGALDRFVRPSGPDGWTGPDD